VSISIHISIKPGVLHQLGGLKVTLSLFDLLEFALYGSRSSASITVRPGDNGCSDGARATVGLPGVSLMWLSCGGTQLDAMASTIVSEVVWNELAIKMAPPAGVSNFSRCRAGRPTQSAAPSGSTGGRRSEWRVRRSTTATRCAMTARRPCWVAPARRSAVGRPGRGSKPAARHAGGLHQPDHLLRQGGRNLQRHHGGNNGAFLLALAGTRARSCSPKRAKLIPLLAPASVSRKEAKKR